MTFSGFHSKKNALGVCGAFGMKNQKSKGKMTTRDANAWKSERIGLRAFLFHFPF